MAQSLRAAILNNDLDTTQAALRLGEKVDGVDMWDAARADFEVFAAVFDAALSAGGEERKALIEQALAGALGSGADQAFSYIVEKEPSVAEGFSGHHVSIAAAGGSAAMLDYFRPYFASLSVADLVSVVHSATVAGEDPEEKDNAQMQYAALAMAYGAPPTPRALDLVSWLYPEGVPMVLGRWAGTPELDGAVSQFACVSWYAAVERAERARAVFVATQECLDLFEAYREHAEDWVAEHGSGSIYTVFFNMLADDAEDDVDDVDGRVLYAECAAHALIQGAQPSISALVIVARYAPHAMASVLDVHDIQGDYVSGVIYEIEGVRWLDLAAEVLGERVAHAV